MSTMDCEQVRELLPAYVDGELELPRALALERHIEGCADCAAALREQRALGKAVRSAPYHRAPDALRARLSAQLPSTSAPKPAPSSRRQWREASRWAMPLAAALVLALGLNTFLATQRSDDALVAALVDSHVRSLQVNHLADVDSSDRHTVKPWFTGKLDYSPPVRDLAAKDFPLIGGRLDYLARRSVAALVYRHRQHLINVYVWPTADRDIEPESQTRAGYNLVHWRSSGMNWWAISDLDKQELRDFTGWLIEAANESPESAPKS